MKYLNKFRTSDISTTMDCYKVKPIEFIAAVVVVENDEDADVHLISGVVAIMVVFEQVFAAQRDLQQMNLINY